MTLENLRNLAKIGELNEEPTDKKEFEGLLASASDRLNDVLSGKLSYASSFDLTYNAAHALALAALRFHINVGWVRHVVCAVTHQMCRQALIKKCVVLLRNARWVTQKNANPPYI